MAVGRNSCVEGVFQVSALPSGKNNKKTRKLPNQYGSSGQVRCGSRTCWQVGKRCIMSWTLRIAGRSIMPGRCGRT